MIAHHALTSVLLTATLWTQALAQGVSIPSALIISDLAPSCPPTLTGCGDYDRATVTKYIGEPVTIVEQEIEVITNIHTQTTPIWIATVTTVTNKNVGICQIISTTTVKTPQKVTVTETVTSIKHRVTKVGTPRYQTYTETVDNTVDCFIPIDDATFTIAAPAGTPKPIVLNEPLKVNDEDDDDKDL